MKKEEKVVPINYKLLGLKMFNELKKFIKIVKTDNPSAVITQVCGPISTGGSGSGDPQKNIILFKEKIKSLQDAGFSVFDQTPFEKELWEIKQKRLFLGLWQKYDYDILKQIYHPIFKSKMLDLLMFTEDYATSTGACWEHEEGIKYEINIGHFEYLDSNMNMNLENILQYLISDMTHYGFTTKNFMSFALDSSSLDYAAITHDEFCFDVLFKDQKRTIKTSMHSRSAEDVLRILKIRLNRCVHLKVL